MSHKVVARVGHQQLEWEANVRKPSPVARDASICRQDDQFTAAALLVRQSIAARPRATQQTLMRGTGERNVECLFLYQGALHRHAQIKTWSERYG